MEGCIELKRNTSLFSLGVLFLAVSWSAAESTSLDLSEPYSQCTFAGKGRYLALHFESQSNVTVYDLVHGEICFEVPQVAKGDLLAGSADKIVVISPSKRMLRRWDLSSGERDATKLLSGADVPLESLMGCSGSGPLLLIGPNRSTFIDLATLEPLEVMGPGIGGRGRYGLCVMVSAAGQTFGAIPTGYGPVGYEAMHLVGSTVERVRFGGTSNAIRWAQPTGGGHLLLQPGGAVVDRYGHAVPAKWLEGAALIPTPDERFFVAVRVDQRDHENRAVARLEVCTTADCRVLLGEVGFEELVPKQINSWHDIVAALRMGHEWRVVYAAEWNRLVTLPSDNRRVLIRPFSLRKKLRELPDGFLYVDSLPPLSTPRGEMLDYRIVPHSSHGGARATLADGPGVARIRKNRLQWRVPDDFAEPSVRFLVSVTDSSEREIFHSFEVQVIDSQ
ncbi:MAG: hypothetical protein KDA42_09065 [Planctomycetales bacterium]|nr:hypothetical protein [Planctomycetales bacterium]